MQTLCYMGNQRFLVQHQPQIISIVARENYFKRELDIEPKVNITSIFYQQQSHVLGYLTEEGKVESLILREEQGELIIKAIDLSVENVKPKKIYHDPQRQLLYAYNEQTMATIDLEKRTTENVIKFSKRIVHFSTISKEKSLFVFDDNTIEIHQNGTSVFVTQHSEKVDAVLFDKTKVYCFSESNSYVYHTGSEFYNSPLTGFKNICVQKAFLCAEDILCLLDQKGRLHLYNTITRQHSVYEENRKFIDFAICEDSIIWQTDAGHLAFLALDDLEEQLGAGISFDFNSPFAISTNAKTIINRNVHGKMEYAQTEINPAYAATIIRTVLCGTTPLSK